MGTTRSAVYGRRHLFRWMAVWAAGAAVSACAPAAAPTPTPAPPPAGLTPTPAPAQPAPTPTPAAPSPTPTSVPAATPKPAQPVAKVRMSFWTPGGSKLFCPTMWEGIMQAYAKLKGTVEFEPIQCGTGQQNFREVLLARIAAGNPPDSTILWDTPVAFGVRGALEPLDAYMRGSRYAAAENWPRPVLASCQFGGKTYGLPVTAGSYGIWYNQELFEKKGIPADRENFPRTWDDLRKVSKQFTQWRGDRLESAGFIPWSDEVTFYVWSALNGSQVFDADNARYTIDSEQNVATMAYAVAWLDEEYKGDYRKVRASGQWGTYPGSQGQPPAFQEGWLAMVVEGSWVVGDLYAEVQPKFERWNVAPFPVGPSGTKSVSGFWPNWLVIPKGSRNKDAAFDWLDYVSGEGVITWYATIPDLPTNKKINRDQLPLPKIAAEKRGAEFTRDVVNFFFRQLDNATPMWHSPVQDFSNDQLKRALERIINKQAKPKDALAEAQKASQAELEKVLKGS